MTSIGSLNLESLETVIFRSRSRPYVSVFQLRFARPKFGSDDLDVLRRVSPLRLMKVEPSCRAFRTVPRTNALLALGTHLWEFRFSSEWKLTLSQWWSHCMNSPIRMATYFLA